MNTILDQINTGVSAYPPMNLTTIPALKTVPSSGIPSLSSLVVSALVSQLTVIVASLENQEVVDSIKNGSGVVPRLNQPGLFIIGNMALSPNHLEKAGIIKPGSSAYVGSLLASALTGVAAAQDAAEALVKSTPYYTQLDIDEARLKAKKLALAPEKIIPDALFISDGLQSIIDSTEAQISILTANMEQALPSLIQSGVITGTESASTIAGLILSVVASCTTMEAGVIQTVSSVGQIITGQPVSYAQQGIPNIFGSTMEVMSSGLSAGKLGMMASAAGPLITHLISLGFTGDLDQMVAQAVLTKYPKLPSDVSVNLTSSTNSSPHKDIPWITMTLT